MAAAGNRVDEKVDVRGHTAGEASRLLVDTVVGSGHYRVAAVGPNRYQFVRTYRPGWTVPVGIVLTVLLFGLGVVLFFIKRTEICAAAVIEDRTGLHVRLDGVLLGTVAAQLRETLGTRESTPPVVVAAFAPDRALASRSAGTNWFDLPPAPLLDAVLSLALQFSTGRRITTAGGGVIGREPVPDHHDDPGVQVIALDDPGLSKTHLSFRERDGQVEIRDRHSTNGTTVHVGGMQRTCEAGVWTALPAGSLVIFGDQRAEVVS